MPLPLLNTISCHYCSTVKSLLQKPLREGLKKNGGKCDLFRTRGGGGGGGGGGGADFLGEFFCCIKTVCVS